MRLLAPESFAHVMEPLVGRRVGYIRPNGNVGDALIEAGTFQLFGEFGIRWKLQNANGPLDDTVDHLVFGGGGNMGTMYLDNWEMRRAALRLGPPLTIFPQSFTTAEGQEFTRVFVREPESLAFYPSAGLAPDLALGLDWIPSAAATNDLGIFLRYDRESAVASHRRASDPVELCRTPRDYLMLAADYRQIITDRLHFAICGLIAGREVAILPNSYHKNLSMHQTWLKALGCRFARSVKEAQASLAPRPHVIGGWWRHAARRGLRGVHNYATALFA